MTPQPPQPRRNPDGNSAPPRSSPDPQPKGTKPVYPLQYSPAGRSPARHKRPDAGRHERERGADDDDQEEEAGEHDDEVSGDDEDDDDDDEEDEEEEEEEEEPQLKYARLTQHLSPVYRNGDATSAFIVAGDKMVRSRLLPSPHCFQRQLTGLQIVGTHNGNIVSQQRLDFKGPG